MNETNRISARHNISVSHYKSHVQSHKALGAEDKFKEAMKKAHEVHKQHTNGGKKGVVI